LHIPDGFLSLELALFFWVASLVVVGLSFKNMGKHVSLKKIPLFAALAGFVFAAQMLNFPVLGGTSGHLIGGALLALLLGFSPAVVIMATILFVQAFVFHDGGVLALGANMFNMAIVAPLGGVVAKKCFGKGYPTVFSGALLSVIAASVVASVQLALSGAVEFTGVLVAMVSVHLVIGLGEAVISTVAWAFAENRLPSISVSPAKIAFVALVFGVFLSPFASALPDGLEATAEQLEFDNLAVESMTPLTAMADYLFPGMGESAVATGLAGLVGVVLVGLATTAVFFSRQKLNS